MEVTMVSIGRSVLSGALGFAKSNFAEEVALQLGVNRDKAFITDELEIMQSFLLTAHEERDEHSRVVRILVKQVRDLAYDVEDGLQDFFLHVHRKSWWRIPRTLLDRHHVARQMKELRAKVEDVGQRNLRYRLIDGTSEASHLSITTVAPTFDVSKALRQITDQHQLRLTFSLAQLIIAQELFSNNQIRVIGIWGASGSIGHASIIWDAYYNPDVKLNFPCRAWVRLASPFHPKEFVQSIVRQFRATAEGLVDFPLELELDEAKTGQELADEYSRYVDEKRYLIVLTGLSTIEEWLQIKTCFLENKMGSRIVVSTEQAEVANLCAGQKSKVYKLEQLSDDHTIYAFYLEVLVQFQTHPFVILSCSKYHL